MDGLEAGGIHNVLAGGIFVASKNVEVGVALRSHEGIESADTAGFHAVEARGGFLEKVHDGAGVEVL